MLLRPPLLLPLPLPCASLALSAPKSVSSNPSLVFPHTCPVKANDGNRRLRVLMNCYTSTAAMCASPTRARLLADFRIRQLQLHKTCP